MAAGWVFDPAPPSGRRSGGNAAEFSFTRRVDTLVREVVQNSLDARREDGVPVQVLFRIVELTGGHLDRFLATMSWDELKDNLEAVPRSRGGRSIAEALQAVETEKRLRLLVVEDRGTVGIEGTERRSTDDERNSYCALVRDELYSDKSSDSAGGSFGLGKSVLWAYSALKTVLFASSPRVRPEGRSGLRFVGRTLLPFHRTDADGECTGDGWLGVLRNAHLREHRMADSVWGEEAALLARGCLCPRAATDLGLTIVIVGFSEPGGEDDRSSSDLAAAIESASLDSFWPAMTRGQLEVGVEIQRNDEVTQANPIRPLTHHAYAVLDELLAAYDTDAIGECDRLREGQSGSSRVTLEVPARRVAPEHGELRAPVPVIVRLLPDDARLDAIRDRIYRFRSPGMVVRCDEARGLSISARPYVAIVPAGGASGRDTLSEQVDLFLRAAEPPEHDRWTHNTRRIRDEYKVHGAKAKLDRFDQAIKKAIRDLVTPIEERGGALPDRLLKHLRFGDEGGGGNRRFISVTKAEASALDGIWRFGFEARRLRPSNSAWQLDVRLDYAVDGGGSEDVRAIASLDCLQAAHVVVEGGRGRLEIAPTVNRVRVEGCTDRELLPAVGTRAAVRLKVDGSDVGGQDA